MRHITIFAYTIHLAVSFFWWNWDRNKLELNEISDIVVNYKLYFMPIFEEKQEKMLMCIYSDNIGRYEQRSMCHGALIEKVRSCHMGV